MRVEKLNLNASSSPLLLGNQTSSIGQSWLTKSQEFLMALLSEFNQWNTRYQQREQLLEMNDHLLHDLGISRGDAQVEASKPFWKA